MGICTHNLAINMCTIKFANCHKIKMRNRKETAIDKNHKKQNARGLDRMQMVLHPFVHDLKLSLLYRSRGSLKSAKN